MIELNWLIEKEKKVHEKENLTSIKPVKPVICASGYRFTHFIIKCYILVYIMGGTPRGDVPYGIL